MSSSSPSPDADLSLTATVTDELRRLRVVPVVVIHDSRHAVALADALIRGGLRCIEITFRTPGAADALRAIARGHHEMLVGAGTVLTPRQAALAREAGARFVVSPGLNPRVVDYCLTNDLPIYPGVCTPTEIEAALERGLNVLKFFPAEPMGGATFLRAISAPYGEVEFIPTGGIGLDQLPGYLRMKKVVACGGSWIAPAAWIDAGAFDRIEAEASRAAAVALASQDGTAVARTPERADPDGSSQ